MRSFSATIFICGVMIPLSCRVHLCCVHIRFLLVHVAPNFAVLLFFCVGLWCMQPATEGSNPHPWTIKKLHYAKNIAQLPRVNSMSLRWHYPNQGYGSERDSLLSAYLRKLPFFEVFLIITSFATVRQERRMFFFPSFFISLRFFINLLFAAGRGRFVKSTRSTLQSKFSSP